MQKAGRIAELDGLRGIAILLVLFAHYCSYVLPSLSFFGIGSLGVEIFFVLSGFLIGGIILDENDRPGFLASFYFRRAARIIPIYFAVCLIAFFAQAATSSATWMQHDHLLPPWTYLTFTTNVIFAMMPIPTGGMLIPTWSLAVEEQFYLCAPVLIMMIPKRFLPTGLGAVCAAAILSRYVLRADPSAVELLLPCRMDVLAIGFGAALIHRNANAADRVLWLLFFSASCMAVTGTLLIVRLDVGKLLAPTLVPLSAAAAMLAAIHGAAFASLLRARWLRFFGEISYGVYLIHQPVLILLTGAVLGVTIYVPGFQHIPMALVAGLITISAATLSWRYFERPIIAEAKRFLAGTTRQKSGVTA